MTLARFSLLYISYCCVLVLTSIGLTAAFPSEHLLVEKFWVVFGFLAGLTFIAYVVADIGIKKNPEMGVMAIMGSIALKMLFSMAFVLIYSMKSTEKSLVFVLNFFSLYLLFTFFEIYCLLRNLRHQNK
ncbi:MAG: hypothetical protein EOO96_25255 [Pedobacter sp.]|nr:MAG: hypothetical protein EOO96_25255 [Pedobacter sp.]